MSEDRLVVLDRDGVINQDSDAYIKSPDEWQPIPGSLEAIARLNAAGYVVAIATNQSGIARGLFDEDTLDAIHNRMHALLAEVGGYIDVLRLCPHGPDDGCDCRKPASGLFHQIESEVGIPLDGVPAIGDSLRDLEAAAGVNAKPILVRTGKGTKTEAALPDSLADTPVYDDLASAVDALLEYD